MTVKNVMQIKFGVTIKVNVSTEIFKKNVSRKGYFWNPATCSCENARYAGSITDDSLISWDEVIETAKSIWQKLFQQKVFQQILMKKKESVN